MDLIGSVGDFQAFEPCLDLVYKGLIKPKDFITHTFPLTEAEKALQLLRDKNEFAFKIILHPQEDN
jgi:threonine dehydrogenase-like Zn-dependent dehydrogenase